MFITNGNNCYHVDNNVLHFYHFVITFCLEIYFSFLRNKCRPWGFNWTSINVWIEHAVPSSNIIISPQFFLNARWHCFPFSHPLQIFATFHAWPIFYANKIQSLLEKPKNTEWLLKLDVKIQKAQTGYWSAGLSSSSNNGEQWRCDGNRREGKEIGR
jgi:hypothetical protein